MTFKGQYCNRNGTGCSASFLTRHFYFEKNLRNLCPIFLELFTLWVFISSGETTACHCVGRVLY